MKNKLTPAQIVMLEPDVHDLAREKAGVALTVIGAIALLFAHGLNAYLTLWELIPLTAGIVFYGLIVVATIIIGRIFYLRDREKRSIVLLCLTATALGPFGAGGMLLMMLLYSWHLRFSQSFQEWFDTIFPTLTLTAPQRIYENIVIGRDEASKSYSVIPFMDVITYGNEMQKMQALSRMTTQFSPSFAPAFSYALRDGSNMVRVQAATAITKIENQFLERLMKLAEIYRSNPREPMAVLAIASHYDDYAYTGILDKDRENTNRELAIMHYMEYLKLNTADIEVRARVGRILLRNDEPQRASEWLAASIAEGYNSDTISMWYGEALYASGRYSDLRNRAQQFATHAVKLQDSQPELADAYRLWSDQKIAGVNKGVVS